MTREGLQEHRLVILTDLDVDVVDASVFNSTGGTLVALFKESFRVALAALAF